MVHLIERKGERVEWNWPKISLFSTNFTMLLFASPLNPNRPLWANEVKLTPYIITGQKQNNNNNNKNKNHTKKLE